MTAVKYPAYRRYEQQRVRANDTMMGLLVGAKLASRTLALTEGSSVVLSEMFPQVDHVQRFNLRVEQAREVLDDAENLLGVLAIPQVLALHEDLMKGMADLALSAASTPSGNAGNLKAFNVHERFMEVTQLQLDFESLEVFHWIRVARNTHIHDGGLASSSLVSRTAETSAAAKALWQRVSGTELPQHEVGQTVRFGVPELIVALAVTKRLAEAANQALQKFLPRTVWLGIIVDDWFEQVPRGNASQLLRSLRGYARTYYLALNLQDGELKQALESRMSSEE